MKLLDGLKLKGNPAQIPDCSRDDLPQFFLDMGYKVGAEIGVFRGEFTEKFCQAGLQIYAIDPWLGYSGAGRTEKVQDKQDVNFQHAKKRLSPYRNYTIIRNSSMDALEHIGDGRLDFVYIDADHRFRYIAEDIYEWSKKVRAGGIVSGHDYFNTKPSSNNVICHVKEVVDAFIKTYNIDNFYTIGHFSSTADQKKRSDRTLSWMFTKP